MLSLLRRLASWSVRHILMFALIVAAVAIFVQLKQEYDRRALLQAELPALEAQREQLSERADLLRDQARRSAGDIGSQTRVELQQRLQAVDARIAELDAKRLSTADFALTAVTGSTETIASKLEQRFRLQLLLREKALILRALEVIQRKVALEGASVPQIEARIAALERRIAAIERRYPTLTRVESVPVIEDFVGPWQELQRTRAARDQAGRQLARRRAAEASVLRADRKFREARSAMVEAAPPTRLLDDRIRGKRAELSRNAATMIWDAVRPVIGWALWIMAAIMLVPPAIKAFWFFVIAPIAARLAPIRIRPDLEGEIGWAADGDGKVGTAVSRRVTIGPSEELLIKPEYLQSSINDARIDTGILLNRKFLFASLATGLAGLTRIRADREATVSLAAAQDLIDEVGIIRIAEGSAMVFQPRNLVGVLQHIGRPLRIESVWRTGHLSSWLTLQLRFLVFHGPCALVVKGARGVALEPAAHGRRIAGAATMGWSAGLAYSVRRSETFFAYLTGKQSLFNDSFEGADGRIVYEQMPRAGARGGFWGRGLEGLGEGMMKIVGL